MDLYKVSTGSPALTTFIVHEVPNDTAELSRLIAPLPNNTKDFKNTTTAHPIQHTSQSPVFPIAKHECKEANCPT